MEKELIINLMIQNKICSGNAKDLNKFLDGDWHVHHHYLGVTGIINKKVKKTVKIEDSEILRFIYASDPWSELERLRIMGEALSKTLGELKNFFNGELK